jgi:hypothetical protein
MIVEPEESLREEKPMLAGHLRDALAFLREADETADWITEWREGGHPSPNRQY